MAWVEIVNDHVVAIADDVIAAPKLDFDGLVECVTFRANPIITSAKADQTVSPETLLVVDLEEVISFSKVKFKLAVCS